MEHVKNEASVTIFISPQNLEVPYMQKIQAEPLGAKLFHKRTTGENRIKIIKELLIWVTYSHR